MGGGGRYDGLIEQLGGQPNPVPPPVVDMFVALTAPGAGRMAFDLVNEARRAGLSAQLELTSRSLKGQLKQADRLGARYVALVGFEDEVGLKHMESGEQTEQGLDAVIPTILRSSRLV